MHSDMPTNPIILSVIMLNGFMHIVIVLSVIVLSVTAPLS